MLVAADAGSALDLAAGEPRPDLILLDVEMPGASGFELCQVLKAEASTADIPVIFLTAHTDEKTQVEGFQLGAVDYITKPINAAVLRARVRTHIALANQRLELERLVRERTAQLESDAAAADPPPVARDGAARERGGGQPGRCAWASTPSCSRRRRARSPGRARC